MISRANVVAMIAASWVCTQSVAAAQETSPEVIAELNKLRDECSKQYAQPRFGIIHDKIPYLTPPTDLMRLLAVKPTSAEREAIRGFVPIYVDCAKRGLTLNQPNQAPVMRLYEMSESADLGGLLLLEAGEITYMEYAMIIDMRISEPQALATFLAKERGRDAAATIILSCVMQSTPDGSLNGLETQYTIDPANNTVTASRGQAPTNVRISQTLITFSQAEFAVNISRATGRFSWNLANNPYAMTGTCEPVHASKF